MKYYISLFIKGIAIGIANVVPGVSGGTIALITGIYEELINSLKSFNIKALKLISSFNIKGFIQHTNMYFLLAVFGGSIASVFSIANLFKYLFANYPISIWSLFFGLIMASVYFIGKRIAKWNTVNISMLLIGTIVAISLSFITPASENDNLFFIFICGFIGVIGMILPGLSGSFLLILMGNYILMLNFIDGSFKLETESLVLLSIFISGSIVGLISCSNIIAWLLKNYKNILLSVLTGFVLGSLYTIWPWQKCLTWLDPEKQEKCMKTIRYLPEINNNVIYCILLMILGIVIVWKLENITIENKT